MLGPRLSFEGASSEVVRSKATVELVEVAGVQSRCQVTRPSLATLVVSGFCRVSTNLYSAESGRTGGGVVEIVTKSGTNRYHGSAYEYIRNDAFDALDYFYTAGTSTTLRQNQFGGSIGGPIKKNKLFSSPTSSSSAGTCHNRMT